MTRTRRRNAGVVFAAVAVAISPIRSWAKEDSEPNFVARHTEKVMGTVVTVSIWTDDEVGAAKAAAEAFAEFRRIDNLMTTWKADSDISKINSAAGAKKPVAVSPEVFGLIDRSVQVSRQTGGAFDITVGAFRGVWKFDEDRDGTIPAKAEVMEKRKLVNYRWIELNKKNRTVRLKKRGMQITLGGIAKGYAVDRGVAVLRKAGFVDFILQAGGDLYVSGKRGSRPWRVGIRDPRGARDATFAIAEVEDHTFSTSGDYERSVIKDGVRYHHILDPTTGYPAKRSRSVTVMAKDALTADAWDTALFIIGYEKGMKLVEKMADLEAVFVDGNNEVHVSSGLKQKLKIQKKPTAGP
jgi:thiamine biosynthesis lipoprotein